MGLSRRASGLLGRLARRRSMIAAVIGAGPHRTLLVAAGSIVVNAAYAAWNLALGVSGVSAWLVTMGCYYAALAVVRFCCVFRGGWCAILPSPNGSSVPSGESWLHSRWF